MFQCVGVNNAGGVQASAFLEVIPIGNFLALFHFVSNLSYVELIFVMLFIFSIPFCFPPSSTTTAPSHVFYHNFILFPRWKRFHYVIELKGSKKPKQKKFPSTTSPTKKPTKPDLKNMVKAQKSNSSRNADDSYQKTKNFSKQALDSLLSRNKNSQFAPGKFPDSSDYLERLNDNQQSESDDEYDDYDDDEGSIHPISSGTDPNVLLHALTNSQKHQTFSDEISHFSNSHINPVTRKIPAEDSKHLSVPLPGPPKAVQAAIIKPRFVTLNWLEPVDNPDEVVSYTVYYKMNTNDAR